jgi:O-acetyl-ADP-ribose deacetylase (regulator of RNase III)
MVTIEAILGDITTQRVDAIVNAANSGLLGGGGVDGAIHRAAGPALLAECRAIPVTAHGRCPTGKARITGGGNLPCKRVIHTVGPVWQGGGAGEAVLLASCYRCSLRLAAAEGLRSVAFPAISTGVYGYPKAAAAQAALQAINDTLPDTPTIERVLLVCFDRESYELYQRLLQMSHTNEQ